MPDDEGVPDAADVHPFLADLSLGRADPNQLLVRLVERLHETPEPDPDLCSQIGVGNLESLLRDNESALWPEVERLARADIRFRRALAAVWAYDSPEFDRRVALLAELGETQEITVRFTVEPDDFSEDPELSWRAFESEGRISNRRLAETLRHVAEWLDRQSPDGDAAEP